VETQEQFTRPKPNPTINALVPDFQEAEDLLQEVAVILILRNTPLLFTFAACLFLKLLSIIA